LVLARIPYREFGDQSLNNSTTAFDALIGANGTSADGAALWQANFNANGALNGTIDITPQISGTTYWVVEGLGEQVESYGANSAVMIGNFYAPSAGTRQLVTTDAGSSWSVVGSFSAHYTRFSSQGSTVWIAGADGIYESNNLGVSWNEKTGNLGEIPQGAFLA
ncbi:MAG: hypothetical protein D6712_13515, partial [Chloroflexi bacterium]